MIKDLNSAGALPALEALMRFSGQRQRIIAHNIANFDTPGFQQRDVSPQDFQQALAEAIDARRDRTGGQRGELNWQSTREVQRIGPNGEMRLNPTTDSGNILFHDQNNRDLERTLQAMVENATAFRVAAELISKQRLQLETAISQRV